MKIGIAGPISTESVKSLLAGETGHLPAGYSGAPFLGTLIKGLLENGHEVSAYTLDSSLPPTLKQPLSAEGPGFKIYYCPMRKHSVRPCGPYPGRIVDFYYREIQALKRAIDADQPDLVHAHWSYEFALAAIYSGKPYLVTCHDSPLHVLKYMTNHYRFGRLLMALWVFKKAKLLTAVSPFLKDQISKFTKAPITVIPNPTPNEPELNELSDSGLEAKLSRPAIVMIVNGWGRLKNAKPAILAFNRLLIKYPEANLHIFGYGYEESGPAYAWAVANTVQNNIVFHGSINNTELLKFLNTATLLLHPALLESCPLSLIEAMSCGLPVVGGKTSGGVPWVLDDGKAGALTDVSSPERIAETIDQVLNDPTIYRALRKKALARVEQLFTKKAVVSAYEAQYREVLREQRPIFAVSEEIT